MFLTEDQVLNLVSQDKIFIKKSSPYVCLPSIIWISQGRGRYHCEVTCEWSSSLGLVITIFWKKKKEKKMVHLQGYTFLLKDNNKTFFQCISLPLCPNLIDRNQNGKFGISSLCACNNFSQLVTNSFLLKFYYSKQFLLRIVTILVKTDQQPSV